MSDEANRIAAMPSEKLRLLLQQLKTKKKDGGTAPLAIGRRRGTRILPSSPSLNSASGCWTSSTRATPLTTSRRRFG